MSKTVVYASGNRVRVGVLGADKISQDESDSCFVFSNNQDSPNQEYSKRNEEIAVKLLTLMKQRRPVKA